MKIAKNLKISIPSAEQPLPNRNSSDYFFETIWSRQSDTSISSSDDDNFDSAVMLAKSMIIFSHVAHSEQQPRSSASLRRRSTVLLDDLNHSGKSSGNKTSKRRSRRMSIDFLPTERRRLYRKSFVNSSLDIYDLKSLQRSKVSILQRPEGKRGCQKTSLRRYSNGPSGMFDRLPDELVLYIFQRSILTAADHARLALSCKRFYRIVDDPTLWRRVSLLPFRNVVDDGLISLLCGSRFKSVSQSKALSFGRLCSLDLTGCSNITDTSIIEISKCSSCLMSINLSGCVKISDKAISHLAKACPKLCVVDLHWCCETTDISIFQLSQHCPNLSELNITWTNATDAGLGSLSAHARNLRTLLVSSNPHITDHGVSNVLFKCKKLIKLDVSFCDRVTGEFLLNLISHWNDPDSGAKDTANFNLTELNLLSSRISKTAVNQFLTWKYAKHTRTLSIT